MSEVTLVWDAVAQLGEGPLWVDAENAVYWVDIVQHNVHRLSLGSSAKQTWHVDDQLTGLGLRERGGFVTTTRHGLAFVDFEQGALTPIADVEPHVPDNRFNDAKVDPAGRFWAGTMATDERSATGSLYRLDTDLRVSAVDDGYIIANGPAFSPNGETMFHTDSAKRVIYTFDLQPSGAISNKQEFVRFEAPELGAPDGMTVDADGCLWVCHFGGSRITRFSPAGDVLQVVPMPVPNVTSCTFGGANLDTLYITTARVGMTEAELANHPTAGGLFSFQPGVRGLPTPRFTG